MLPTTTPCLARALPLAASAAAKLFSAASERPSAMSCAYDGRLLTQRQVIRTALRPPQHNIPEPPCCLSVGTAPQRGERSDAGGCVKEGAEKRERGVWADRVRGEVGGHIPYDIRRLLLGAFRLETPKQRS